MPTIPTASPKASKPAKPMKAPEPEPTAATEERPVIYPDFVAQVWAEGFEGGPIKAADARTFLGWESEAEYLARLKAENPALSEEEIKAANRGTKFDVDFGSDYLLIDELGDKVRCRFNGKNRPFDEVWTRKFQQELLKRRWAGPTTYPGETCNGETIIISRTGEVNQGQKRLCALVLAEQRRQKEPDIWTDLWPTEVVMESVIVFGASDLTEIVGTLDNGQPRSLSDTVYTSQIFADLGNTEKKEVSRMAAKAIDFLWQRVGAGGKAGSVTTYQTHAESRDFIKRHPRLEQCVRELFEDNKDRVVSRLKLSPGQCAACLYLMGSSLSDGDAYRSADPPSEDKLNWKNYKKAREFLTGLFQGGLEPLNKQLEPVRNALSKLIDPENPISGRATEKFVVLAKAWQKFLAGEKMSALRLMPEFHTSDTGETSLAEFPDFGGIDQGPKRQAAPAPKPPTKAEIEEGKAWLRQEAAERAAAKIAELRAAKSQTIAEPGSGKGEPGKPPAPKLKTAANGPGPKAGGRKKTPVEIEQTRKAAEADAKLAAERAGKVK